jgi:hypothetical protein
MDELITYPYRNGRTGYVSVQKWTEFFAKSRRKGHSDYVIIQKLIDYVNIQKRKDVLFNHIKV